MKKMLKQLLILMVMVFITIPLITGCSNSGSGKKSVNLVAEPVGANSKDDTSTANNGNTGHDNNSINPGGIFSNTLGVPISRSSMGVIDPDPTGQSACTDYDGDGIPNAQENTSNEFVADYPRIVAKITPPITMEIRIDETSIKENHSETIEEEGTRNTIADSMEDKQYSQLNQKTTPYVTKESSSQAGSQSDSYGWTTKVGTSGGCSLFNASVNVERSENESHAESFERSHMSEKTVFENVDYIDNLDRGGTSFTDETVKTITSNARKSEVLKKVENIGPNNGLVRAAFFLKNQSVNMPARISNVICTLTFRTAAGEFLPVRTFKLRNEDYSEFNQEIYGNEELGPYTIELRDLNTNEVRKALLNGYIPQIHVVSYDISRVRDSNYNPGVDNLKIVEETAKGRTALIKISAPDMREDFRVCAFDVTSEGNIVPGISLKKALFNIFRDKVGDGESWAVDQDGNELTVPDENLRWRAGSLDKLKHGFVDNRTGNQWRRFSTYIKTYTDEYNQVHKIETIKQIELVKKYNPFSKEDNPSYDPSEFLSDSEISKMKYWVILHNGRYFEGDLNDPIWVGERYEIICFDAKDFNDHFKTFNYTPLQSHERINLETRWNRLNNDGEFARSAFMGTIYKGDIIHLEVDLLESRRLLPYNLDGDWNASSNIYHNYKFNDQYMFEPENLVKEGIPSDFTHTASGDINNIQVVIEQGKYVSDYELTIRNSVKNIKIAISAEEVSRLNGKVNISRKTLKNWNNGEAIGKIPAGDYYVDVKALNRLHAIPVHRNSLSNGNILVKVSNIDADIMPGDFTYRAIEGINSINIAISGGSNTEYYLVKLEGPYNYPDTLTINYYVCYPGENIIKLDNPSGQVYDSGVYNVNVYPINNNLINSGMETFLDAYDIRNQFISVGFERFSSQKKLIPALEKDLKKFGAVDLEVNFNDGTGWYRLQVNSNDSGSKKMDCRFSSYFEYDKQKFHIFFKVPHGHVDDDIFSSSIYDIFTGGREETALYIRTVADQEYRDRFWLKNCEYLGEQRNNYICNNIGEFHFLDFWLNNDYSDATYLEGFTGDDAITAENFKLSSKRIDDYFFAPLDYRLYSIRASFADDMYKTSVNAVDQPSYTARPMNHGIFINDVDSVYLDSYKLFWRKIPNQMSISEAVDLIKNENIFTEYTWNSSEIIKAEQILNDANGDLAPDGYLIGNLTPNQKYIIALVGYNKNGNASAPRFYNCGDNLENPFDNIEFIIPYSLATAPAPSGLIINQSSQNSIEVANLYVDGYVNYEVQWRTEFGDWSAPIEIINDTFKPYTLVIDNVNYWGTCYVRARALTIVDGIAQPIYGEYSAEYNVDMLIDNHAVITKPSTAWEKIGWNSGKSAMEMEITARNISIPIGSVEMTIEGYVICDYHREEGRDTSDLDRNQSYRINFKQNWDVRDKISISKVRLILLNASKYVEGAQMNYERYYFNSSNIYFKVIVKNRQGEILDSNTFTNNIGNAPIVDKIQYQTWD